MIPKLLKIILKWYHNTLYHAGESCAEVSTAKHFYLKNLRKTVNEVGSIFKLRKETRKAENKLWYILYVDLICQFQLTPKQDKRKTLID